MTSHIAFIGGGNMARAILSGLLRAHTPADHLHVLEPQAAACADLRSQFGLSAHEQAGAWLSQADVVVWAVKPQQFAQAAQPVAEFTRKALHLSVAAGIPLVALERWLGSTRLVRCMPNTPALIGQGMTALVATALVDVADRAQATAIVAGTGRTLWLDDEAQIDVVTAMSGSGPAYVFYFLEAMTLAGTEMGLSADVAHQLACQTFVGASALAAQSSETPSVLRQRVTSKGGTTHAAISAMEREDLRALFIDAIYAARDRSRSLTEEFGRSA